MKKPESSAVTPLQTLRLSWRHLTSHDVDEKPMGGKNPDIPVCPVCVDKLCSAGLPRSVLRDAGQRLASSALRAREARAERRSKSVAPPRSKSVAQPLYGKVLLSELVAGQSLRAAARTAGVSERTASRWLRTHREELLQEAIRVAVGSLPLVLFRRPRGGTGT